MECVLRRGSSKCKCPEAGVRWRNVGGRQFKEELMQHVKNFVFLHYGKYKSAKDLSRGGDKVKCGL